MKKIILAVFVLLFSLQTQAKVDTVVIPSKAMNKSIKAVVITPKNYKKRQFYPTVYLLHGYSDYYGNWIRKSPKLQQLATLYQFLIVCPDGGFSSWYFDSPIDSTFKYRTYVGEEVVNFIDEHYSTIKQKTARAITGLSMGGHGALYLAKEFPLTFGACGSMSGGVNLFDSKNRFHISKRIGDTVNFKQNWIDYSAVKFLPKINTRDSLKIIIDCGVDDFFFEGNQLLHANLIKNNIPHDYIVRPGAHQWTYWISAIEYQLLFFNQYFISKL